MPNHIHLIIEIMDDDGTVTIKNKPKIKLKTNSYNQLKNNVLIRYDCF